MAAQMTKESDLCLQRNGMRQIVIAMLTVLAIGALFCASQATAGEIKILAPATGLTLLSRNNVIHVVVKLSDANDFSKLAIKSVAKNKQYEPLGKWKRGSALYVHYAVPLKVGTNKFKLAPTGQEFKVKFKPLRSLLNVDFTKKSVYLFHRNTQVPSECKQCHTDKLPANAPVDPGLFGQFSPVCYSCHAQAVAGSKWRHSPAANLFCRSCHESKGKGKVTIPEGDVEKLCFRCHVNQREWKDMSHIHGPVGTGDCTICHDPHGESNRYQLWTDGKSELCIACHTDMKKYVRGASKRFYVHGILSARGCVICHSPHATNYKYQLYSDINDLCTSCHTLMQGIKTGHPVQDHPTSGAEDPRRSGHPFTCTSCHNPHGSSFQHLLIGDLRGGHVCKKCHG